MIELLFLPVVLFAVFLYTPAGSGLRKSYLFRDIVWSHVTASYLTAIIVLVKYHGPNFFVILQASFVIFISPLILPIFVLGPEADLVSPILIVACYVPAFCIVLTLLRVRQKRAEKYWRLKVMEMAPAAPVALGYYSTEPVPPEPYGRLGWISLGCGVFTLLIQVGFCAGAARVADEPLLFFMMSLLFLSAVVAAVVGAVGCFRTRPRTPRRQAAFFSLCVGLLCGSLPLFWAIMWLLGLEKYGG